MKMGVGSLQLMRCRREPDDVVLVTFNFSYKNAAQSLVYVRFNRNDRALEY